MKPKFTGNFRISITILICIVRLHESRCASVGIESSLTVNIPQGTLKGISMKTYRGRSISAFLGIPFAEPPTGSLRFAAPVPRKPWNSTFNATVDGPDCAQLLNGNLSGQEDCLHLNLFTPRLPKGNKKKLLLPTMVYIFGGGFIFGSTASAVLGPQYLLDEDVLLVVPNYRLGPLGFMSTGDKVMPGNYALKDLVLAFKWVRKNIKFFGGDPTRVTLFGHSSGGASAHLLALSPLMDGLFHRYITQSGSAFANRAYIPKETCRERAFQVGQFLGCSTNDSSVLVKCLREKKLLDIVAVTPQIQLDGHSLSSVWGPTDEPDIKGALLTDSPVKLIADGKIPDVPWLTGVTRNDGLLFTGGYYHDPTPLKDILPDVDEILNYDLIHYGSYINQSAYADELKKYYLHDLTADIHVLLENVTDLMSDAFFIHPTWYAVQNQAVFSGSPTYLYTFDYVGTFSLNYIYTGDPVVYDVGHGDELIYMFDLYQAYFSNLNKSLSSTDIAMKDRVVSLWTSFATYGVPYTSPNVLATIWEPYNPWDNYVLRIGHGSSPELSLQNSFYNERMRFFDDLNARYFNDPVPVTSHHKTTLNAGPALSYRHGRTERGTGEGGCPPLNFICLSIDEIVKLFLH